MNSVHENNRWLLLYRAVVSNSPSFIQEEGHGVMDYQSHVPSGQCSSSNQSSVDEDVHEDGIDRLFIEVSSGFESETIQYKTALCFVRSLRDIGVRVMDVSSPWTWRNNTVESTSLLLPLEGTMEALDYETESITFPPRGSNDWTRQFQTFNSTDGSPQSMSIVMRWKPSSRSFSLFDGRRLSLQLLGTEREDGTFESLVLLVSILAPHLNDDLDERAFLFLRMRRSLNRGLMQNFFRLKEDNPEVFGTMITYSTEATDLLVDDDFSQLDQDEATFTGRFRHASLIPERGNGNYLEYGVAEAIEDDSDEFDISNLPVEYKVRPAQAGELERFPTFKAGLDLSGEMCPVCQCDLEAGQDVRKLVCVGKHVFHRGCIDEWLLTTFSCPVDRTDFTRRVKDNAA